MCYILQVESLGHEFSVLSRKMAPWYGRPCANIHGPQHLYKYRCCIMSKLLDWTLHSGSDPIPPRFVSFNMLTTSPMDQIK